MSALAVISGTIRGILSYRNYTVLTISTAASLAVAQIALLLMLFWAKVGFQGFIVEHGIYFFPGAFLPELLPVNTLLRFYGESAALSISPLQFFGMLLISALVGIYVSLMVFYRRNCVKTCRREAGIGVAGFGVGGAVPIVTSSVTVIFGCCGGIIVMPLVGGIATSILGAGMSVFGLSSSELFRTAGIIILVACIYWVGSKISSQGGKKL